MSPQRTTNPPQFPPLATALLVLGALLSTFLPRVPHAEALTREGGRAIAVAAMAGGVFLAMRHYWAYDKPLFKGKAVLFAVGVGLLFGLYALVTHSTGVSAGVGHH